MANKNGIIAGIAAVAVIGAGAIIYISQQSPPVLGEDATGAISAADRYHAEQITAEDVQIEQVELQEFLQTDVFDQIVNDPAAARRLCPVTPCAS